MKNKVICKHPRHVVSPQLKNVIFYYTHIHVGDKIIELTPKQQHDIFNGESIFRYFSPSSGDDTFELLNSETGEVFPIVIDVPCGKCEVCRKRYKYTIQQRCEFESQSYKYKPLFITLTYNDYYLPFDRNVCKKHVQLFKKRLNKLVKKEVGVDGLKYLCVSEYGKLLRPHYHIVLFGDVLKHTDYYSMTRFIHMVNFCWRDNRDRITFKQYLSYNYTVYNIGSSPRDVIDPCSYGFTNVQLSRNCVGYVTKYITKNSHVPAGHTNNFMLVSQNLGMQLVMQNRFSILQSDGKFEYYDKFKGCLKSVYLCGYYVNKIFPSFAQIIPSELRKTFYFACYYYRMITQVVSMRAKLHEYYNMYQHVVSRYSFLENPNITMTDIFPRRDLETRTHYENEFWKCYLYLYYFPQEKIDKYIDTLNQKLFQRDTFFALFADAPERDIAIESFKANQESSFYKSKSVLL